jgi:glycerophosphoryl diester phosphodiesterase
MTSDGVIVVSHDDTVDRCTDGTGRIMDKTLSEIKALDAGYRFTPDNGATYPCRGMGYTIPTLEEVFADPELNRRPMVLEIKQSGTPVVGKVLDLIEAYDMEDQLIVGAFNQDTVNLIGDLGRSRGMNLVRIFATEGVLEFIATPCWIMDEPDYAMPGDVLALPKEIVTHLLVQKAWVLGLKTYVWTVNDESGMVRFKETAKVDGIMTDNPERLEALLVP